MEQDRKITWHTGCKWCFLASARNRTAARNFLTSRSVVSLLHLSALVATACIYVCNILVATYRGRADVTIDICGDARRRSVTRFLSAGWIYASVHVHPCAISSDLAIPRIFSVDVLARHIVPFAQSAFFCRNTQYERKSNGLNETISIRWSVRSEESRVARVITNKYKITNR